MKHMLSNGNWASDIKDFEDVMEYNDFRALENMMNDTTKLEVADAKYWQEAFEEEQLHSDSLYQRNMNAWTQADEIITYLLNCSRMNKVKLLDMLRELQNDLENY